MNKYGIDRTVGTPDGYSQQPEGRANLFNQTYIGYVKKVEDDIRMGRLQVWIPELGGDPMSDKSWYTMNYCSPFAGATPIDEKSNSLPVTNGNKKDGKKWLESQRSYGFWAVPPDVDNEVVCMFVNGDPNKGIWIGCMFKQYMNHMVPGIPRNNSFDEGEDGELPPVVEYNKWSSIGNEDDPTRPRFDPLHEGLKVQGLYKDVQRGPASGGARRESPSKVFGLLSPRGNHIYIDDFECNEMIRMRTRSGVQVMLHETDGYIYMVSKKGNSWLQISDDGIDFYSSKGVNIRSQTGYNFHTDKDYNLHIGGSFNVFCEGDMKLSTKGNADLLVGKDRKEDIGGASHSQIKKDRKIKIEGADNTDVQGKSTLKSGSQLTLSGGSLIAMKAPSVTQNNPEPANEPDKNTEAEGAKPEKVDDRKLEDKYPADKRDSIVQRMPTHEPFDKHPGKDQQQTASDNGAGNGNNGNSGSASNGNASSGSSGGSSSGQGSNVFNTQNNQGANTPANVNPNAGNYASGNSDGTTQGVDALADNNTRTPTSLAEQENRMDKSVGMVVTKDAAGTAVLIDNSGNMMTNSHVVGVNAAPGTQVQVNINGELRDATVVSNDSSRDVAQIRLSDSSGLTPVSVGSAPKAGDSLYSYGYANAQPNLTRVDATFTGETGRSTTYSDPGADLNGLRVNGLSVMQTTSASGLAPGMSGGPVFNSTGQLVGINAATTPGINRAKFVPI
jgi:hypothetical protein